MHHPAIPSVREIMSSATVTVTPNMPALDAAALLLQHDLSGVPVVDEAGHLLGLLSEFDCLRAVSGAEYQMDTHDATETVADLMTQELHTVTPDLDLFGLAHEFVRLRVRRFPVLDAGRLVGVVGRREALRAAVQLRRELMQARRHYPDYPKGRDPIRDYPRGK